jgi:hypothetical protein
LTPGVLDATVDFLPNVRKHSVDRSLADAEAI